MQQGHQKRQQPPQNQTNMPSTKGLMRKFWYYGKVSTNPKTHFSLSVKERCEYDSLYISELEKTDIQKYNGIAGPNPASKTPKNTRATNKPPKLKPVDWAMISRAWWDCGSCPLTIKVEVSPQPAAAQAIHTRGGKSFEMTLAGIWQMI
jgi:hypothetical protein